MVISTFFCRAIYIDGSILRQRFDLARSLVPTRVPYTHAPIYRAAPIVISAPIRGGEWPFKNYRSCKILVEFHRSRSLVSRFLSGSVCLAVRFFSQRHFKVSIQSRNIKIQQVSQRKTLVSPSRKVSTLPFAIPPILIAMIFLM